jgi:membrane protease YdiL (CAAX protease family)
LEREEAGGVPDVAQFSEGDTCEYCGAELNRRYYFCLRCARPYIHPNELMPPVAKFKSTAELLDENAPQVSNLFWSIFAVLIAAGLMTYFTFQDEEIGLALIISEIALACVTMFYAVRYRRHLLWQFQDSGFRHKEALMGLGGLAVCLVINYVYATFLESLVPEEFATPSPWERMRQEGYGTATLIVLACIAPAVIEEIAFRGLMQHWLGMAMRPRKALIIAAALFAAMHFSALSFPYLFLVGLLLGWTWWKTRSLYPPMLLHFLHNFVVIEYFG